MSEYNNGMDKITLEKFEEVLDCVSNFRDVNGFDYNKKYALVIPEDVAVLDSGTIKNSGIPSFDVLKAVSSIDTIIADSVTQVGDFNSLGINVKNFIAPKCEFVSRDAFVGFSNLSFVDLSQINRVDGIDREAFRNAKGVKVRIPENLKDSFGAKFPNVEIELAPSVGISTVSAENMVSLNSIQDTVAGDIYPKVSLGDIQNFSFSSNLSGLGSILEDPEEGKMQKGPVKTSIKFGRSEKRINNQDPNKRVTFGFSQKISLDSVSETSVEIDAKKEFLEGSSRKGKAEKPPKVRKVKGKSVDLDKMTSFGGLSKEGRRPPKIRKVKDRLADYKIEGKSDVQGSVDLNGRNYLKPSSEGFVETGTEGTSLKGVFGKGKTKRPQVRRVKNKSDRLKGHGRQSRPLDKIKKIYKKMSLKTDVPRSM